MNKVFKTKNYIRIYCILIIGLLCFISIFYYSCGEQLYSRDSEGNIKEFGATNDTGELTQGSKAEQIFTSDTDTIQNIGVMASNYGREINGMLKLSLYDMTENKLISQKEFSGKTLGINQYAFLDINTPLANMRGHTLKITAEGDGQPGDSPTVLYSVENHIDNQNIMQGAALNINGNETAGIMCITMTGRDNVWTGPNYWKIALLAMILASIFYWIAAIRYARGKRDYIFTIYQALVKYKFLIRQLVSRDFKVRYKRSVLGVLWSLLNPMLMMTVQYMVFSQIFKSDIENYPVYLLSGLVVFNFFSEGVGQALTSVVGNASLITKVYMPKYVYPVTRVLSSGINLLMSLIPLVLVAAVTHEEFTKAYIMLPYFLICLVGFTIGFGMLMSALMVFFRDVQFLWGILSLLWMYLTPIFYPLSILPDSIKNGMNANPMIYYITPVRDIVLEGITPEPYMFFQCAVITAISLIIGGFIFKKAQDKFIFYI